MKCRGSGAAKQCLSPRAVVLPDPVVLCDGGDLVEGVGSSLAYASMPIPVEVADGKVKLVRY